MDPQTRQLVRARAVDRCEYCRLRQSHIPDRLHHVEHIKARQHGGTDDSSNLTLACRQCNLRKGPNLSGVDPDTSAVVRLFNPRTDAWSEHFRLEGPRITGLTAIGRTTVWVLNMNSEDRIELRSLLMKLGELD